MQKNTGVVEKSTGSRYIVRTPEGVRVPCQLRGRLRNEKHTSTNPIAVGDVVDFTVDDPANEGSISQIHERKNYIIRQSTNLSKRIHILASNIDLAFLVVTISQPETPVIFIDRFLLSAEVHKVPVAIVFNKQDIYSTEEKEYVEYLSAIYTPIGYPCLNVSAYTGQGIDDIRNLMTGKVCIFAGNSGVGKSTLINAISPSLNLRTGSISGYHKKGKHTTTFAEMHDLENNSYLVDTPGIKSFGVVDMSAEDIAHNFREIFARLDGCKFYNCTHSHEPGCKVREAVADGSISESRYTSYLSILLDENEKYRASV